MSCHQKTNNFTTTTTTSFDLMLLNDNHGSTNRQISIRQQRINPHNTDPSLSFLSKINSRKRSNDPTEMLRHKKYFICPSPFRNCIILDQEEWQKRLTTHMHTNQDTCSVTIISFSNTPKRPDLQNRSRSSKPLKMRKVQEVMIVQSFKDIA